MKKTFSLAALLLLAAGFAAAQDSSPAPSAAPAPNGADQARIRADQKEIHADKLAIRQDNSAQKIQIRDMNEKERAAMDACSTARCQAGLAPIILAPPPAPAPAPTKARKSLRRRLRAPPVTEAMAPPIWA